MTQPADWEEYKRLRDEGKNEEADALGRRSRKWKCGAPRS